MKYFFAILAAGLIAFGIFNILNYIYRLPTRRSVKTINALKNNGKKSTGTLDEAIGWIVGKVTALIRLKPVNKLMLQESLDFLDMSITPEEYVVRAWFKGIVFAVLIAMFSSGNFYILGGAGVIGFLIGRAELGKVNKKMNVRKDKIEADVPRFCQFLSDMMKTGAHNVIDMVSECRKSVSSELRRELDITVADMKTGNQIKALSNLSTRVNSPILSQVVLGLESVLGGNDETIFFATLSQQLHEVEISRVKKLNSAKPQKLNKLSMVLVFVIIAMILGMVILTLVSELKEIL